MPLRGAEIRGSLHGGQQPVSGAAVYLYAASTSGYGAASVSLLDPVASTANNGASNVTLDAHGNGYVSTDNSGNFTISGDYNCNANQYVYLVAVGGNPGLGAGKSNPNIALMAALGSCNFLKSNAGTTTVNINEVTTVGAAYALAQFFTSVTGLGSSSANTVGLTNAFAMVNNLVNYTSGTAPGIGQPTAGGGAAGLPAGLTIPTASINSLANTLAACVNSDPTTTSTCSSLFSDATPPGGTTPADTAQAAINIAHNPGLNVAAIFGLGSATPPFGGGLASAPNDWTLIAKLTGGGLSYPYQVAVDSVGNVWAADISTAVTKISPAVTFLSGSTGYTGGGIAGAFGIAIDGSDNAWVTNTTSGKGGISRISTAGVASGPYTGGGVTTASAPRGIAVDTAGNIWTVVQTGGTESLNKFGSDGTFLAGPIDTGGVTTSSQPYGLAINAAGELWATNRNTNTAARLSSAGAGVTGAPYAVGTNPFALAFDAASTAWVANYNSSTITALDNTGMAISGSPFDGGGQLNLPSFVAVDGLNTIWVANYGTTSTSGCLAVLKNTGASLSPVCYGKGTVAYPHGLAIDGSGNVWIGSGSVSSIYFVVGAAAPVVTPLSVATNSNKLGTRP